MRKSNVLRIAVILPALLLITGCISLTEAQLEARDYRRIDFKQQFIDFRQRCSAAGGRIIIDAKQGLDRHDLPNRGDRYYCL
ncbi:MAG: hypothetical protein R3288_16485 [Woeseiaceae bacterium]|nr:hypothetical protein [Woeseiaceae bacterium]